MKSEAQLQLWPNEEPDGAVVKSHDPTFLDNMRQPVHRWFRFSAGYSGAWVETLLKAPCFPDGGTVLDPFAGSGTTLLAADAAGVQSIGIEAHPFVTRIAQAKLAWNYSPTELQSHAAAVLSYAQCLPRSVGEYPKLISVCFPDEVLADLNALRTAWDRIDAADPARELTWLAITSSLRRCSPVGTANMELIQPKKRKTGVVHPFAAFRQAVAQIAADMQLLRHHPTAKPLATLYQADARRCHALPIDGVDLVVTSPPYANNFDYADALRLEMTFWGVVRGWADLHPSVRRHLLVSCSQHASAEKLNAGHLLEHTSLRCLRDDLRPIIDELSSLRLLKPGHKHYDAMVAAYFLGMAEVWESLRKVCKPSGRICMVIGDSAPYGVHVPVPVFLGRLALAAGFSHYSFVKQRDRNVKWKNRKHTVPLVEGQLWVEG